MPRVFVGNFDFEWTLAGRAGTPPAAVARSAAELAASWLDVAEDGDCIWTPEPIDAGFFAALSEEGLPATRVIESVRDVPPGGVLCPWGWTHEIRRWVPRGVRIDAPPQDAVRSANSRRFSMALEHEWGVGLLGACLLCQEADVADALKQLTAHADRWVMKAEFGMSARERLLGRGRNLDASAWTWLRKRLACGSVALEPWVERLDEVGVQFDIPSRGDPRLVGITPLLTDPTGVYRGSRFGADPFLQREWAEAIGVCRRAAVRLQESGYFGPAGFDAMRYRAADGSIHVRPLQDINARWTMGRLALGFERLLPPAGCGAWLHLPHVAASDADDASWTGKLRTAAGAGVRLIPTSPATVGGQAVRHRTLLLLAESREDLLRAEFICA